MAVQSPRFPPNHRTLLTSQKNSRTSRTACFLSALKSPSYSARGFAGITGSSKTFFFKQNTLRTTLI